MVPKKKKKILNVVWSSFYPFRFSHCLLFFILFLCANGKYVTRFMYRINDMSNIFEALILFFKVVDVIDIV